MLMFPDLKEGERASWDKLVLQAKETLRTHGPREVYKHARVSVDNLHLCRSCFTCACVHVWREHVALHPYRTMMR